VHPSRLGWVRICQERGTGHQIRATLVGVALIQLWWAVSFVAGARGNGSGVASAGILGAGWAAMTNGIPIV
jgi:hypothetical protein